jgi:diguanylate cyclase (GGDEF)-like protein
MIEFVQRRIGRRITVIVGTAMGALAIFGLLLLLAETSVTQNRTEKRLAYTLAQTIAASFQSFDPRLGQHPIGDITAELSQQEYIQTLQVFDEHGRIRWAADPRRKGSMVDAAILQNVLTSTAGQADAQDVPKEGESWIAMPLRKRGSCLPCHSKSADPIGGVVVQTSHHNLLGSAASFPRQAALLVIVSVVLITFFFLYLIDKIVVARIAKLVQVMGKAEEGDFMVRAEVSSNDEIGLLASTFNKLLAKITDLRVEHIDKEREMSEVKGELSLKHELARKGELLEAANQRLSARLHQLSFLYDLGRDLASELDLDPLLDRIARLVNEALHVPEFVILLADRAAMRLHVAEHRGLDEKNIVDKSIDLGSGLIGEAAKARAALWVPNLTQDGRALPYRSRQATPLGCVLFVPVIYQDELVGILAFSSPVIDAFREEERELFSAVGNQAALALANARLFQETLALSNTDGLTGILNRRAMESRLDLEWSRALRDDKSLSVVMIDIDHFKVYNDQNGHQLGDETLRRVARILEGNIRKVDAVARYGGEEFVVILPRATKAEAFEVAQKLRRSVEQADFVQGYMQPLGRVTISCGIASAPDDADGIEGLISLADEALFLAKQGGRNQVVATTKRRVSSAGTLTKPNGQPAAPVARPLDDDEETEADQW